jgi:hypothetical protein
MSDSTPAILHLLQAIPLAAKYLLIGSAILLLAAVVVIILSKPERTVQPGQTAPPGSEVPQIQQETHGHGSPAVGGIQGDVNISIDQQNKAKEKE